MKRDEVLVTLQIALVISVAVAIAWVLYLLFGPNHSPEMAR